MILFCPFISDCLTRSNNQTCLIILNNTLKPDRNLLIKYHLIPFANIYNTISTDNSITTDILDVLKYWVTLFYYFLYFFDIDFICQ